MKFWNVSLNECEKNASDVTGNMFLLDSNCLLCLICNHEKYHFLLKLLSSILDKATCVDTCACLACVEHVLTCV